MRTNIVKIRDGENAGVIGYETWCDSYWARITPIYGDPLASIEVRIERLDYLNEEEIKKLEITNP